VPAAQQRFLKVRRLSRAAAQSSYTSSFAHRLHRFCCAWSNAWHFGQRRCFNILARSVRGRVRTIVGNSQKKIAA
jgi:hypothetical protein